MRILFAAPVTYDRITFFVSDYFSGLARAAVKQGHTVRLARTTENIYNPLIPKRWTNPYNVFRNRLKPIVDFPHDMLMGTQILREVDAFKPDFVVLHVFDTSYLSFFIKKIRQRNVKVLFWLGVHPSQTSRELQRLLEDVSCVLYYDSQYASYYQEQLGVHHIRRLPLGCEIERFDAIQLDTSKSSVSSVDICFVGLFDNYREQFLKELSSFNLGIWSWNIGDFDTPLKKFDKGVVFGEDMIRVFKSAKIVVNLHREFEMSGGNYRLFEICGAGAFQLVDEKSGISEYFVDDKELVTFTSKEDLHQKVRYFLEHDSERERIAEAGHRRVCEEHTLMHRMRKIVEIAGEIECNPM